MAKANPIPAGFTSVTPHLVIAGVKEAIEFYRKAFGATARSQLEGPGGKVVHAEIEIGGAMLMLAEEMPEWGALGPRSTKGSPVSVHLYVPDVDAVVERAVKAGARVTMPVADQFWGDRYGTLEDPYGHRWGVATHMRDVSEREMAEAMRKMAEAM
jgi:PhnB protein